MRYLNHFMLLCWLAFIAFLTETIPHLPVQGGWRSSLEHSSVTDIAARTASNNPNDSPEVFQNIEEVVWKAIYRVLLPFLFGWGMARFILPFRGIIAVVSGLVAVVIVLLAQIELIEFTIDGEKIEALYEGIKHLVLEFGLLQFLAFLVGIGAGTAGFRSADNRIGYAHKEGSQK